MDSAEIKLRIAETYAPLADASYPERTVPALQEIYDWVVRIDGGLQSRAVRARKLAEMDSRNYSKADTTG